jgi:hypothetical protein
MRVPVPIRTVVEDWKAAGRPAQDGIGWPQGRWSASFPDGALPELPARLDRAAVRAACAAAPCGPEAARQAFLAVMAWGYGNVGYGPWRTTRILDPGVNPTAGQRLAESAAELLSAGPLAAYRHLGGKGRLRWLGPAFGTKYLYFCPQPDAQRPALILDRPVARWLADHIGIELDPVPWAPDTYARYLDLMREWADALGVAPDVVEERILVSQTTAERNQ